jgi:hypothetical protein
MENTEDPRSPLKRFDTLKYGSRPYNASNPVMLDKAFVLLRKIK